MADVVVAEFMDDPAVALLAARYDVRYDPELGERADDLAAAIAPARALVVRNRTRVSRELLAAAPDLEVVGRLGVGLDNIDLDACRERGIEVCPATGANAAAVAEYVIGAILMLFRGLVGLSPRVAAGEWPRTEVAGREAAGTQLGLVGFGAIARLVAVRAAALGMTVAAHDPLLAEDDPAWERAARMPLAELLATSDAVSLHVPLTDETRRLVDAGALAAMKQGAVVINTSRGGIVDEEALADALRSGRLGGAALDVFATEPVDAASGARFAGVPNLLLTPHIAGITAESNARVSAMTAASVIRVLEGT